MNLKKFICFFIATFLHFLKDICSKELLSKRLYPLSISKKYQKRNLPEGTITSDWFILNYNNSQGYFDPINSGYFIYKLEL